MKVIIAGSKRIVEYALLERAITRSGFHITTAVSARMRGVFTLGELYAERDGIDIEYFTADYVMYPSDIAERIRNLKMIENADALIAVWDGFDTDTLDLIRKAKSKGLRYFLYNVDLEAYEHG